MAYAFEASQKAYYWHKGQMYGEHDYFFHLNEVALQVEQMVPKDSPAALIDSLIAVSFLHDILEDTDCTIRELTDSFSDEIVLAVVAMTKWPKQSYEDYIQVVKGNYLARKAKIADTLRNLTNSVIAGNARRVRKYTKQLNLLIED